MTHDEPEIEATRMNQEALQDVRVAAQMRAPHPARVVEMRKRAFDPFAALAHQAAAASSPHPATISGGSLLTPQGNNVHTVYVDLSGEVETKGLCLVKATEPQWASRSPRPSRGNDLATASTIRLSLPKVFRHTGGEVLIQDEQEGRARTSASESVDVPSKEPERR